MISLFLTIRRYKHVQPEMNGNIAMKSLATILISVLAHLEWLKEIKFCKLILIKYSTIIEKTFFKLFNYFVERISIGEYRLQFTRDLTGHLRSTEH